MRLDKFLKVSRILKRRTVANAACDGGRVAVNGKTAKPSHTLKEGDIVEIGFGSNRLKIEVLSLQSTARKEDAENMYRVIEE
jgi:ribosomal 50S subunit-recycling heat shock protein